MPYDRRRIASIVAPLGLGVVAVPIALWFVPIRVACTGPNVGESFGWCFLAWYFVFGPLLIAGVGFVTGLVVPGRGGLVPWLVGVTAGAVVAFLASPNPEDHVDVAMILLPALVPALVGFPPGSWLGREFRRSWARTNGGREVPRGGASARTAGTDSGTPYSG